MHLVFAVVPVLTFWTHTITQEIGAVINALFAAFQSFVP